MQLATLVNTSLQVTRTRSRLKKKALLAACLREAGTAQAGLAVHFLGGTLPQGRIGLGPAVFRDLKGGTAAAQASLDLGEVDSRFQQIAATTGTGSRDARARLLAALFARATDEEQHFLCRLVLGELRQGALEGVLVESIAEAAELPPDDVRRAVMLAGTPAPVAEAAMRDGAAGLARFRLEPLVPVRPMLAQPADGVDNALNSLGEASLEYKLDGARVQVHRVGSDVRIFSRAMNDVTQSLPEIVEETLALPVDCLILDGEAIALREDGRPLPFQVSMRRFGRKTNVDELRGELPMSVFFFDTLYWEGEHLIDQALSDRLARLEQGVPGRLRVPRLVTGESVAAGRFMRNALSEGHEGIMAKSLGSHYAAGNRGADWLKVKHAHTLDLVVLAAEWGSGRRKGWLSNLHLGARGAGGNGFVMLGKTFKGMTDKMLRWQTRALLELEIGREGRVVHVKPELVVEIAVNEIQSSQQYPGGMALRFARVKRYRNDKQAAEADTVESVGEIFRQQAAGPAAS